MSLIKFNYFTLLIFEGIIRYMIKVHKEKDEEILILLNIFNIFRINLKSKIFYQKLNFIKYIIILYINHNNIKPFHFAYLIFIFLIKIWVKLLIKILYNI